MQYGRVLVVDDAEDIVDVVRSYLEKEGYEVVVARDGPEGLEAVARHAPDVIVLDVMLPRMDGLTLCREIRRTRQLPILMLSARGDDMDKILGLEVGADDYLVKPFNPKELVARVRAMFRRLRLVPSAAEEDVLTRGPLKIFLSGQRVELSGAEVRLTPLEFLLLKTLVSHAGQAMTRQDLLNKVWGPDYYGDERTVDVHVRHLRAKLSDASPHSNFITSVWGVGYRFDG